MSIALTKDELAQMERGGARVLRKAPKATKTAPEPKPDHAKEITLIAAQASADATRAAIDASNSARVAVEASRVRDGRLDNLLVDLTSACERRNCRLKMRRDKKGVLDSIDVIYSQEKR